MPYDPGPRRGHSFHLWNNSVYLFGGRDNDIFQEHIPKTYKIVTVNGTLQFSTYDQNPVQEACNNVSSPLCQSTVPLGVYYNDIWEYPLGISVGVCDSCVLLQRFTSPCLLLLLCRLCAVVRLVVSHGRVESG